MIANLYLECSCNYPGSGK